MKEWAPFWPALHLRPLLAVQVPLLRVCQAWSGPESADRMAPTCTLFIHKLRLMSYRTCNPCHHFSFMSLGSNRQRAAHAHSRLFWALTAPTPTSSALLSLLSRRYFPTLGQHSTRSPDCTFHKEKEHPCLGHARPPRDHGPRQTFVGWKRARDEKVWWSPKACKRPRTSKFLLKKQKQSPIKLSVLSYSISLWRLSHKFTEDRTSGKLTWERKTVRPPPKFLVPSWCFGGFAGSFFFFFFGDTHMTTSIPLHSEGGFLRDLHHAEWWNRLSRFHRNGGLASVSLFWKQLKRTLFVFKGKNSLYFISFFENYFIYLFLERGEGRERGRETLMCGCLSHTPNWGLGQQPRHVPWLGIQVVTLWFAGQHSVHWATPARAKTPCISETQTKPFTNEIDTIIWEFLQNNMKGRERIRKMGGRGPSRSWSLVTPGDRYTGLCSTLSTIEYANFFP